MTHVVVIGGGIAGLAAAYELTGGAAGPTGGTPTVSVLDAEVFGGKLRTVSFAGRTVDVGPDGFLARRPEATSLIGELGAASQLVPISEQGAWVYARRRLRRLPAGLALGVPTRVRDLRTADAIRMLGVRGSLRAAVDLVAPRPPSRSALADRAIGPLVADKLGRRVVDVLVDPLIGGIHAGRVKDLSAAAVFPPLLAAGQQRGSMMRALRSASGDGARAATGPAFVSLADGAGSLVGLLGDVLASRGVRCTPGASVASVRRGAAGAPRWTVETDTTSLSCDAVVLATPPATTADLLLAIDADASALVRAIDAASVATITLLFDEHDVALPDGGTGLLVPVGTPGPHGPFLATAVTFLDRKWGHLARDGERLLRVSVGRIDDVRALELDDQELVNRVTDELSVLVAASAAPSRSLVTRWPASFPQYHVNHLVRVEGIEAAAGSLGGLAVAGAAYRGVGVPACIGSGRAAARAVRAWLVGQS